ncbi:DUF397 domain-containing protein [Catellatospora sichuanensis]|uniref:DUF397 domain-containing protein n=1 Tax=Catellatospora sichuanensis TaxID=1969805 RepID=UPI001C901460|nr:DUF397 domain-containing protein [Catellatospora sichuanensis]
MTAQACESAHCVEVCFDGASVLVRSSREPDGPWLTFDREEWRVFCAAVAEGEFRD